MSHHEANPATLPEMEKAALEFLATSTESPVVIVHKLLRYDALTDSLNAAIANSTHAQTCPAWHYLTNYRDDPDVLTECDCWRRAALALVGAV